MSSTFPLGHMVITTNAGETLNPEDVSAALRRHASADWCELDDEDRQSNERALKVGGRLFSAYTDRNSVNFWIITEADRSVTTVLLPDD